MLMRRFQILGVALIVALSVGSSATATPAPGMCVDLIAALEHTQETANLCASRSARCTYYCDNGELDRYECECVVVE